MRIGLHYVAVVCGSSFTLSLPVLMSNDYSNRNFVDLEQLGDREAVISDSRMQKISVSADVDTDVVEEVFDSGFVVSISLHTLIHSVDVSVSAFDVLERITAIVPSSGADTIEIKLVDTSVLPTVPFPVSLFDRSVSNLLREVGRVLVPLAIDDPSHVRRGAEVVRHSRDSFRRDVQKFGRVRDRRIRGEPRELCGSQSGVQQDTDRMIAPVTSTLTVDRMQPAGSIRGK